jgi:cryptochrome
MPLDFEHEKPQYDFDRNANQRSGQDETYIELAGPKGDFAVPTIAEIGIKQPTSPHRGGESKALAALDKVIANEKYTATFEKPKTAPTAFNPQSTTLLSPHMHFGSLSCREFYWRVSDVISKAKNSSSPPVNFDRTIAIPRHVLWCAGQNRRKVFANCW